MINFIIVDDRLRSKVVDTRVYRGINSGTDHFLVVCRIKALCQRWRHHAKMITTELGQIKVERWKKYFESVFTCEDTVADDNVNATEYMIDDGNENEITIDEIMKAQKATKVGKAYGYDRVSSEMLSGGEACGLQEMVNKVNDSVKKKGMKVNIGKTKVVFQRAENKTECDIFIKLKKLNK
ncbi:hypothetical protein EVAR_19459_1 [Eumeta japonica]|uniref:Craniofacial development protein 2 n=1 Tax=Eumeta variegata TaxID=151549 RepID=A0A4C1V981_EUMVA|nr:hypothetical protein EVAR_19459_1 [Eumeta japonica]